MNEWDQAKWLDHGGPAFNNGSSCGAYQMLRRNRWPNFFSLTMDGSTDCSSVEQENNQDAYEEENNRTIATIVRFKFEYN